MKLSRSAVSGVVITLLESGARRATKYLDPKTVVSACLPCYGGKVRDRRATRTTIVMKIGAPNYEERRFIKSCQKAGEPFPVRKVQLKFPPKRQRP